MALNPIVIEATNKVPVSGENSETKTTDSTPVKERTDSKSSSEILDEGLEDSYVEKRSITISLVHIVKLI